MVEVNELNRKGAIILKELKMPVGKFDAEGFVADIMNFLKSQEIGGDEPEVVIAEVEEHGATPKWGDTIPGRNIVKELLQDEKALFFTFSGTDDGDPVPCADGKSYSSAYEDDDEDEVAKEGAETDEVGEFLGLGEAEVVGYVLKVSQGELSIKTVIHGPGVTCCQAPSVEYIEDAGQFEQAMSDYVKRFVRE